MTDEVSARVEAPSGKAFGGEADVVVGVGSAASGLLSNVAAVPGVSFVLTVGFTVLGFLLSLRLPHLLVLPHPPNAFALDR